MSFYDDLKRKVDEEKAYKKASVIDNESKIVSVRPDSMIMALIEIFSYMNEKAPAEYVATHFSMELASYVMQRKETIISLNKILNSAEEQYIIESDDSALDIMLQVGALECDFDFGLCFVEKK